MLTAREHALDEIRVRKVLNALSQDTVISRSHSGKTTRQVRRSWSEEWEVHGEQVQLEKFPNGQRPWFGPTTRGRLLLRSGYTLGEPPDLEADYVHEYRIPTFSNFLCEMEAF